MTALTPMGRKPLELATGSAPVAFLDTSGKQIEVPLSLLQFGPTGIDVSNWSAYTSFKSQVDPLFALLVSNNLLRPGDAPAAIPALQIAARDPGSSGNQITIGFANIVPNKAHPDQTKVDATVSVTQSWGGADRRQYRRETRHPRRRNTARPRRAHRSRHCLAGRRRI